MDDPRARLRRFMAAQRAADRPLIVALAVSAAWLMLVGLFWLAAPADGSGGRWTSVLGVVLPLALIWLAAGLARAIAQLRAEATELRAELARIEARRAGADADMPPAPTRIQPAMARQPATPRPDAAAARQSSLHLDAPPRPQVLVNDLLRALNFPDGPDDTAAIAALRAALADPETRRLIRAAQDVVTLFARHGLFMDDLPAPADGALWRRYAEGQRGAAIAGLSAETDPEARALAAELMRGDEIFRDAAHHFLRQFDRTMTRLAGPLDDGGLSLLADTRSGRAFSLLAQTTGMFG